MQLIKEGILTTVQDLGRSGYASIGVNTGGAMDRYSLRILNILLDNCDGYPAIEMYFPAPQILFQEDCQFALYGADFEPELNQTPILNGKIYAAGKGDILKFKRRRSGNLCYLGVKGILNSDRWLNSYSRNAALNFPEMPRSLEILPDAFISRKSGVTPFRKKEIIRFVPEFEYELLDESSQKNLSVSAFSISKDSNRMGYRLQSAPLNLLKKQEMLSSAVSRGTIQLLPDGQLIILMADAQTTGGYPKIGYVSSIDLNYLTQLDPGSSFRLEKITQEDAVLALREEEAYFRTLELTLRIFQ